MDTAEWMRILDCDRYRCCFPACLQILWRPDCYFASRLSCGDLIPWEVWLSRIHIKSVKRKWMNDRGMIRQWLYAFCIVHIVFSCDVEAETIPKPSFRSSFLVYWCIRFILCDNDPWVCWQGSLVACSVFSWAYIGNYTFMHKTPLERASWNRNQTSLKIWCPF